MLDKTGTVFEMYQTVEVPAPNEKEYHSQAFIGSVIDVLEDRGTVIVEDKCGDAFEIEPERLEIVED